MRSQCCRFDDEAPEKCCRLLSDRIHDMWFNLDELEIDHQTATVQLPLGASKSGPFALVLICKGIEEVNIQDTEKVGLYDIQDLKLDVHKRELRIRGNIPVCILVRLGETWELSLNNVEAGE